MKMKSNETQSQNEQLRRLASLWSQLTSTVRRSILELVEGAIELHRLNRGRGDVHSGEMDNILHTENHYDYDND